MFQLSSVSRPLPWDCRLMPKPWTFLWVTPGGRFQIMGPFERWFDQLGSLFLLEDGGILPGGSAVRNDDVGGGAASQRRSSSPVLMVIPGLRFGAPLGTPSYDISACNVRWHGERRGGSFIEGAL